MKKLFALITLALALSVAACGPLKYEIQSSQIAAGADAVVVADVNKEGAFTRLKIEAKNLPPPGRVKDGKTDFVIWARESGKDWQRVAALPYSEGERSGKVEEISVALMSFDLQITAEDNANPDKPSEEVVFSVHVN
jgi:hypothetical protein